MLKLKIITPQKEIVSQEAVSVTCQTVDGEITILPRHSGLLTLLSEGVIKVKDKTGSQYFSAGSGYVETDGKQVQILISRAAGQDELDEQKLTEAKNAAEKLLSEQKDASERRRALAMLQRTSLDLKVIRKLKRKV